MSDRIILRRDTAANWAAVNPILAEGELGIVTDTKGYKIGDGVTRWNDLEYPANPTQVVNELGDSETTAISQKAVKEEINDIQTRINFLLDDVKKIFILSKKYINPSSGDIINTNDSSYIITDYINVANLKDVSVTLSGHIATSPLALYNADKTCIYVKPSKTGLIKLDLNSILSEHDDAVYAVMCNSDNLNKIVITPSVSDIYIELKQLGDKLSELSEKYIDIERNIAPKALSAYDSITKSGRIIWNELTNDNTWQNNSVSAVPFIQKVDETLNGKVSYGIIYTYYRLFDGDALYIQLGTIDTEVPTENTIFTPYYTYKLTTFEATKRASIDILFETPILIKDNSYIRVVKAPVSDGGAAGNGTSSINYFNKSNVTTYVLPYSAVKFKKKENTTLGVSLITSLSTMRKDVDDLKVENEEYRQIIRKDVDYGVSLYTEVGFVGSTIDDENNNFLHSDYIDISDVELMSFPTTYDSIHFTGAVFYNNDKGYLSVVGSGNENNRHYYRNYNIKENVPNAKYVRFCINISYISIQHGVVLKYNNSNNYISDTFLSTINKGIKLYLPDKIYCLAGRTLQIFKRSILYAANIDNFIIEVEVISGNNRFTLYPNFIEFSPISGDGEIVVEFIIKNNLGDIIIKRKTTCVAVEVPQSPLQIKNILFVGDSWTQAIYPEEVSRMLCNVTYTQPSDANFPDSLNLTNINFIGTNNNEAYLSNTYREGASGKTLAYHLSSNSPFYDVSKQDIDFTTYINSGKVKGSLQNPLSGNKIDIIVLLHGRNNTPKPSELTHFIKKAKEHNPNIIIFIGLNYISATLNNTVKAGGIMQYYQEEFIKTAICDVYENVYLLQVDLGLDTRYNMICKEIDVNYRNTKYKELANNFNNTFHPNNNGYLQLADEVFFQLCNFL